MENFIQVGRLILSYTTIILLLGTGIILTFITRGIQIRRFFSALKFLFCDKTDHYAGGEVTHFESLNLALCATIGSGNIVGIATAILLGGTGAIFWMWIAAFFSMATRFTESLLAVQYRTFTPVGEMVGGPMYYMRDRLRKPLLAFFFAIFAIGASLTTSSIAQGHVLADVFSKQFHISGTTVGIVVGLLVLGITFKGIDTLKHFVKYFAPTMIILYCGFALFIICSHPVLAWNAVLTIISSAFSSEALTGGMIGTAIRYGIGCGIFSNEAGMGTTAIASACAKTEEPANQALVSMIQVFVDTFVICTFTALIIIMHNTDNHMHEISPATFHAFGYFIGPVGHYVVLISLVLFAFSTICAWEYYGEKCIYFLFGKHSIWPYKILYIAFIFLGTNVIDFDHIIHCANTFNELMAITNLIALILFIKIITQKTVKIEQNLETKKMEVRTEKNGNKLECIITGKIDTVTSVDLQKKIDYSDADEVTFDLSGVDYLSSAGLRYFIICHKALRAKSGTMKITKIQKQVKEVFEMVGLNSIMDLS